MNNIPNKILSHEQIQHKVRRIAWQIYETFAHEEEIILAGIAPEGSKFADKLGNILEEITTIKITICHIKINKKNPFEAIETSIPEEEYQNKAVVLIDDVLNSGSTLVHCVKHFLQVPMKKLKTAVFVNRNHKLYPVKADFKGISLSTSLQEHITVDFNGEDDAVYLQ
ncbi:phosphoribosyltransferase family protein [Ascidiimonas sp. W6]|uniref:phosphoribosyltransferase family protein n=1 Tax=Ascidiimonas meishanensis TaxID=3128903 RepID=UPI0030EF4A7C